MATLQVHGQMLFLLPEKAVFLPQSDTLLVADTQIGMVSAFRTAPAPQDALVTDNTLCALTRLITRFSPKNIIFLGDLLHPQHALAISPDLRNQLHQWRELHHTLAMSWVRAAHHDSVLALLHELRIHTPLEPLMHHGLALCHQPVHQDTGFVLAGALQPSVNIGGIGGRTHDWLRLPCFWFSDHMGVLPAFGSLSGIEAIRAKRGDRVFAVATNRVFELHPAP
jgi:uncharacterized protein